MKTLQPDFQRRRLELISDRDKENWEGKKKGKMKAKLQHFVCESKKGAGGGKGRKKVAGAKKTNKGSSGEKQVRKRNTVHVCQMGDTRLCLKAVSGLGPILFNLTLSVARLKHVFQQDME